MAGTAQVADQAKDKQYIVFKGIETMDTQSDRIGLDQTRAAWLENLQPIATNKLQCVPGPGAALATLLGEQITRQFSANYANADFNVCFCASGAAYQVNLGNGVVTQIAPAGTFSDPDVTQWQSERILIADPTAGYSTWDGTLFVKSGGVSPVITVTAGGSGYTSVPTVTISGGSGSGATAEATVLFESVISIQLTSPGVNYQAGDVLTVTIGGPGTGATATAQVFPIFTFAPTTIAVAFGRVWLAGGRVLQWSGTGGYDDSSPANAAGFLILPDADLVHSITALRCLNNFLYILGDNSVKQIGNIIVSGSATVFAITTLSSDTGTTFKESIASYERLVCFCNYNGVYVIFGASVEKISDEMDGVFPLIDFISFTPQAMVITINSIRCYLLLVRYNDPTLGPRSLFMARQRKKWFIVSQGSSLLSAASAVVGGRTRAFASSGSDLTPILIDKSVPVSVLVQTALTAQNKEMLGKRMLRAGIVQSATASGTVTFSTDTENGSFVTQYNFAFPVTWVNALGQAVQWINNVSLPVFFVGVGFLWQEKQAIGSGIYLGCTLSGNFTGFRLNAIVIEYEDAALMRSKNKV